MVLKKRNTINTKINQSNVVHVHNYSTDVMYYVYYWSLKHACMFILTYAHVMYYEWNMGGTWKHAANTGQDFCS
jgi:hypothetical protein